MMSDITCDATGLRRASYRGVEFWVESDRGEFGRRIVTHQFPMRDDPYNEDLGEKAREFHVTGYVVGSGSTAQKDAIKAACTANGPAMLILPAEGPLMAVCNNISIQRSKDRIGYFELQMRFTADPGAGALPSFTTMFEGVIAGLIDPLSTILATAYDATFSARNVLQYVVDNAQTRVATFASVMLGTLEAIGVDESDEIVSDAITTTINIARNVAAVVRPSYADQSNIVSTIGGLFSALNNYPAASVLQGVAYLATFSDGETDEPVSTSRSVQQDYLNASVFCGTVRKFALVAYARAAAVAVYTSRKDAITMRATLMQVFEQEMNATTDEDTWNILASARDYAVKAISETAASLVPVVVVNSPITMPSLYWSYRLYGDTTRSTDLSDRNEVATPAFMPQTFEALKP